MNYKLLGAVAISASQAFSTAYANDELSQCVVKKTIDVESHKLTEPNDITPKEIEDQLQKHHIKSPGVIMPSIASPHVLIVFERGKDEGFFYDTCDLFVIAGNMDNTNDESVVLISGWEIKDQYKHDFDHINEQDVSKGETHSFTLDQIRYDFKINRCEHSASQKYPLQIELTQDLSARDDIDCIDSSGNPKSLDFSKLTWQLSGRETEIRNRRPDIVIVPKNAPAQVGHEISVSNEIAFSEGDSTAVSGGFSLLSFQANLSQAWDKSSQIKHEEGETQTINYTLDGNICNAWQVDYFKTVEEGQVSAPKFTPADFTVTRSQRLVPTPLCEADSNVASANAIKSARESIQRLDFE